jgi:hypothetical protein
MLIRFPSLENLDELDELTNWSDGCGNGRQGVQEMIPITNMNTSAPSRHIVEGYMVSIDTRNHPFRLQSLDDPRRRAGGHPGIIRWVSFFDICSV